MSALNDLEVLVENLGRVNYFRHEDLSINSQRKGLVADVQIDGNVITHWQIIPLEFKKPFVNKYVVIFISPPSEFPREMNS
jgi:hypothetical protein